MERLSHKQTLVLSPHNLSAHNVYYVKSGVANGNPLVIYVKSGKAF